MQKDLQNTLIELLEPARLVTDLIVSHISLLKVIFYQEV